MVFPQNFPPENLSKYSTGISSLLIVCLLKIWIILILMETINVDIDIVRRESRKALWSEVKNSDRSQRRTWDPTISPSGKNEELMVQIISEQRLVVLYDFQRKAYILWDLLENGGIYVVYLWHIENCEEKISSSSSVGILSTQR